MTFLLPPAKMLADSDVAGLLYAMTGLIDPALGAVEHLDPFGIKGRTFAAGKEPDTEIGSSWDLAATAAKAIGGIDDSLVWISDAAGLPGTAKWESWRPAERRDWWIKRVGPISTLAVAYPGVFGVIARRLPLQTIIGFGQQAILLCAVARAYGVDDRYRQTDLLALVLCKRTIDSKTLLAKGDAAAKDTRESSGLVQTAWSGIGRSRAIVGELARRPSSRQPWRMLGALPVVGAVADYVGESSALRRAADAVVRQMD